jgi:hypothetical protein
MKFNDLFIIKKGYLITKLPIYIEGVTISSGVTMPLCITYGGIDLTPILGKDLEVSYENTLYFIKGYYD